MKIQLLDLLRCPLTQQKLLLTNPVDSGEDIVSGLLTTECGKYFYPIKNGIPRFVPTSNYADNFGMQWNHFRQTQLDSYSGQKISKDRFFHATGWLPQEMEGQWILDVGCGAGRFAEVALNAGAKVIALDYSSAIDACYENLRNHSNLHLVQGDIYALPFPDLTFPYIYSLGVLQHTPDVEKAFHSLVPKLGPTGKLCVDFYWKRFRTMLHAKYLFRPITKRMPQDLLFSLLQKITPSLLLMSNALRKIPLVGKLLMRAIPVANYCGIFPLTDKQLQEWALLDTFDMLAPAYDQPQSAQTIKKWFAQDQMEKIEVFQASHLVGRGCKSAKR